MISTGDVEGLQALELTAASTVEEAVGRLVQLHQAGIRLLGLNHFVDTALSGSAHGENRGGLSMLGRQLLPLAEQMGFVLDLAHA